MGSVTVLLVTTILLQVKPVGHGLDATVTLPKGDTRVVLTQGMHACALAIAIFPARSARDEATMSLLNMVKPEYCEFVFPAVERDSVLSWGSTVENSPSYTFRTTISLQYFPFFQGLKYRILLHVVERCCHIQIGDRNMSGF